MGNLSQMAYITQSAMVVLFAELACHSASRANDLMAHFPGFRAAKGNHDDPFWLSHGVSILAACREHLAIYEQKDHGRINNPS